MLNSQIDDSQNLLTVIVPLFNRSQEIERVLTELEAQTCQEFEIVFVDDGSTDDTAEVLSRLEKSRKFSFVSIPHSGPCCARNQGAKIAETAYYIFIDSDDSVKEEFIAEFVRKIRRDEPLLIQCGLEVRDRSKRSVKIALPEPARLAKPIRRPFLSGTYCIIAELFWSVGGFTECLRYSEHRELALKLVSSPLFEPDGIALINKPLYTYYRDSSPWATYNSRRAHSTEYILKIHEKALSEADQLLTYHRLLLTALARGDESKLFLRWATVVFKRFPGNLYAYAAIFKACMRHLFTRIKTLTIPVCNEFGQNE